MSEIVYLFTQDVIDINADMGYSVREFSTVDSQVMRCQQGYGDQDFYPTVWDKAAVLLEGLASTQGFSDGNKRTAVKACLTFLAFNNLQVVTTPIDGECMTLCAACGLIDLGKVKEWLTTHQRTPSRSRIGRAPTPPTMPV